MPRKIEITLYDYICNHPEVENLFYEYSDSKIAIDKISAKNTANKVRWYCEKHKYSWEDTVFNRINYPQAPCCAHHVPTEEYNFAVLYPDIAIDWDYTANTKLPEQYLPNSHERIYWKCHKCKNEWNTKLFSRTQRLTSCPKCSLAHTSKAEMILLEMFKKTFTKSHKGKIDNLEYDIIIPEIKVLIEYDGYPWHLEKKDMHIRKLQTAVSNGYTLINIAEYKDRQDIIQDVRNQYTDKHNVIYYSVSSNYNLDGLLDLVREYFKKVGNISLNSIDKNEVANIIMKTSAKELNNSLWNSTEIPWIRDWIAPKDIDKAKSITPSSSTDITIKCPNCGREWTTKAHWLKKQFRGCTKRSGGCGFNEGLNEQLERSSDVFRNNYLNRADKLKEQRENKKQV